MRQTRWDYTIALLHYSNVLGRLGGTSSVKLGQIDFSSYAAAVQCACLSWNIGHVPGTFAVEKGIYRFLADRSDDAPADVLPWPYVNSTSVAKLKQAANSYLLDYDYFGVPRVLAVIKLLSFASSTNDEIFRLTTGFLGPFLLNSFPRNERAWIKVREYFKIVRHLAYLTIDAPYSGLQWGPNIPAFVDVQIRSSNDLNSFVDSVSEVLSPVERLTFESVYHSERARRDASVVAGQICQRLKTSQYPNTLILGWMLSGSTRNIQLPRAQGRGPGKTCASIRLRSHLSYSPSRIVDLERSLESKGIKFPGVFQYRSWNSEVTLEPDELIIDSISWGDPTVNDVGKLLAWFLRNFEDLYAKEDNSFQIFRKGDFEKAYVSLFGRIVEIFRPGWTVSVYPWRFADFGLFRKVPLDESKGAVWAAPADLGDPITKHIVRLRAKKNMKGRVARQYEEVKGLRELRKHLLKEWGTRTKRLRHYCLVCPASVVLSDGARDLIEFDGGILKIMSRSGAVTWYGLETKSNRGALRSLERRVEGLAVGGTVRSLGPRHAFVEMQMRTAGGNTDQLRG